MPTAPLVELAMWYSPAMLHCPAPSRKPTDTSVSACLPYDHLANSVSAGVLSSPTVVRFPSSRSKRRSVVAQVSGDGGRRRGVWEVGDVPVSGTWCGVV